MTENKYLPLIEEALPTLLPSEDCAQASVVRAMRYSLLAPGKRLRPTLVLAFYDLTAGGRAVSSEQLAVSSCGCSQSSLYSASDSTGQDELPPRLSPDDSCEVSATSLQRKAHDAALQRVLPAACTVEMIHAYSLIHDDLPCMDDDELRRGKPSCHVVFGEDIALLAGDALQSLAFSTLLSPQSIETFGTRAAQAAGVLAQASGACGMVGGQVIDLETENKEPQLALLTEMYNKKTGALIQAACAMGCILAGAGEKERHAARVYAESLGLAFQIVDDILDVTSTTAQLGKKTGSDAQHGKRNYVTLLGVEKSREIVDTLTAQAQSALAEFSGNTDFLQELALGMAKRVC